MGHSFGVRGTSRCDLARKSGVSPLRNGCLAAKLDPSESKLFESFLFSAAAKKAIPVAVMGVCNPITVANEIGFTLKLTVKVSAPLARQGDLEALYQKRLLSTKRGFRWEA